MLNFNFSMTNKQLDELLSEIVNDPVEEPTTTGSAVGAQQYNRLAGYNQGDVVDNGGYFYRAKTSIRAGTAGLGNTNYWERIDPSQATVEDDFWDFLGEEDPFAYVPPLTSETQAYLDWESTAARDRFSDEYSLQRFQTKGHMD